MITYAQRAERIMEGILGASPTPQQIRRAAEALYRMDYYSVRDQVETPIPDPTDPPVEALTEYLVRNCYQFVRDQIQRDSEREALKANDQIIKDWIDDDLSDFPPQ